jgi:hypothetical protein
MCAGGFSNFSLASYISVDPVSPRSLMLTCKWHPSLSEAQRNTLSRLSRKSLTEAEGVIEQEVVYTSIGGLSLESGTVWAGRVQSAIVNVGNDAENRSSQGFPEWEFPSNGGASLDFSSLWAGFNSRQSCQIVCLPCFPSGVE